MTIEEKSKAYDEALERARKLYERGTITESLGYVFPELSESEDEKVRKALAEMVHDTTGDELWIDYNVHKEEALAWLEKQGEQKPIDKVEPKFKVGDWVFIEEVKGYKNGPFQIKTVDSFGYNFDEYHTIPFMYEELLSKWTIKNAKPGDVLQLGSVTAIFQKYIGNGNCKCYCSVYNGELEIPSQDGTDDSYGCCNAVIATKEQCDTLMKAMTDAGYTFDFEKKELKKIEQKPTEWSEEDEEHIDSLLKRLDGLCRNEFERTRFAISEDRDWLKSLKERIE